MIKKTLCHDAHKHKHIPGGGVLGVKVTVIENGHGDPSSNTGQGCLHFT